jgi:hypothetical protein
VTIGSPARLATSVPAAAFLAKPFDLDHPLALVARLLDP